MTTPSVEIARCPRCLYGPATGDLIAPCAVHGVASRDELIESYASFWWAQETGETDRWEDLELDEREAAVVENSYAETVADWLSTPPETGGVS